MDKDKISQDYLRGYVDCQTNLLRPLVAILQELQDLCNSQVALGQELTQEIINR